MRRLINSFLIIFCMISPARADELLAPVDFNGHYDFTLAGIPFGKLDIKMVQDATHYDASSDIGMTGVAKVFVQHESHTTSKGTGAHYLYPNVTYSSRYATKGKKRVADIIKKDGVITSDHVEPADNAAIRPPVATPQKSAAYDPVSIAVGMRLELARVIKSGGKDFTVSYYDGRRLARGNFTYAGERALTMGGVNYAVYTVVASRTPVAGFTEKELSRMKEKEPPLTIYFAKETLLPLRLELPMMFGMAAATLKI